MCSYKYGKRAVKTWEDGSKGVTDESPFLSKDHVKCVLQK